MIIAFPIGGTGNRFVQAGFSIPKPLIPVLGKPMLQYVLEHYPTERGIQYLFSVRDSLFKSVFAISPPDSCLVRLTEKTNGPVETLLHPNIQEEINNEEELLIADCDSFLDLKELQDALKFFQNSKADGGVIVRPTLSRSCSFAEISENGYVSRTAEKIVLSNVSTSGPYWFRKGSDFISAAKKEMKAHRHTISPCYNQLIVLKKMVVSFPVETFVHLGTPEELDAFHRRFALQQQYADQQMP